MRVDKYVASVMVTFGGIGRISTFLPLLRFPVCVIIPSCMGWKPTLF